MREHLNGLVAFPNPSANLVTKQQGYYHYLHGVIESQTNLTKAEKSFRKALSFGLSMSADEAMAKLSLAGNFDAKAKKTRSYYTALNEAKKADTHNVLGQQIKLMQQQIKKI